MVFNFKYDTSSAEAGGQTYTWLVRFTEQVNFDKMQEGISTALFEGKWGKGSWKKLKVRCAYPFPGCYSSTGADLYFLHGIQ